MVLCPLATGHATGIKAPSFGNDHDLGRLPFACGCLLSVSLLVLGQCLSRTFKHAVEGSAIELPLFIHADVTATATARDLRRVVSKRRIDGSPHLGSDDGQAAAVC